jgi:hypothetical protein
MSGLAAGGGGGGEGGSGGGSLQWQGGSQEAAYRMAMERASMEGPAPAVIAPAPLAGEERPEVVCMADTDVSVGIEVSQLSTPSRRAAPRRTQIAADRGLH